MAMMVLSPAKMIFISIPSVNSKKTDLPTLNERTMSRKLNNLLARKFPFRYPKRNMARYNPWITPSPLMTINIIFEALIKCKIIQIMNRT